MDKNIEWSRDKMLEVTLKDRDDFLLVKETLTRIGIAAKKNKIIFQSCHILHKRGLYYIVHFKELFELDGKETNLSENDIKRRNTIAILLQQWNLLHIVNSEKYIMEVVPPNEIKILSFNEKRNWELKSKYTIGSRY